MRSSLCTLLGGLGYRVLQADSGDAALALLGENSKIDLILSDVIMPGRVDGPALAEVVHKRYPGIKVLLMSGYTQRVVAGQHRLAAGVEVITKPFENRALAKKIHDVLNR